MKTNPNGKSQIKRIPVAIITLGVMVLFNATVVRAQTMAICTGDRERNAILLLTHTHDSWAQKKISEGRGLSIAFDSSGKKLVAVSRDTEAKGSQVNVYDAGSGELLNHFKLDNFGITSNWMKQPDGPAAPYNLIALPDGKFAVIGFKMDADKVCVVEFSAEKELSRKVLEDFPDSWLMFGSTSPVGGTILIRAWAKGKPFLQYGLLDFTTGIDFKEMPFGKDMVNGYFQTPTGFIGMDHKLNCSILDKEASPKSKVQLQSTVTEQFSPGILGMAGEGQYVGVLYYQGPGTVPTDKAQFVLMDFAKGSLALGPETELFKYAAVAPSGKDQSALYVLPEKGSALQIYSLPDFKLTQTIALDVGGAYEVVVCPR